MSYVTDIQISTNLDDEKYCVEAGFTKIDVNLNTEAGGNNTYLWWRKGDRAHAITRVQVTFNENMTFALKEASYTKIEKNLNAGTPGVPIYMWYSRTTGAYDVPIIDFNVTINAESEAKLMSAGGVWEEVSCNLNLGNDGAAYVYAWMKREQPVYICDVNAAQGYISDLQLLSDGFTRVDVNTNMGTAEGAEVFIWYRKTTVLSKSLSDLCISTNPEQETEAKDGNFEKVDVNLNEKTGGGAVYLWSKKEPGVKYVRTMVLLLNKDAVATYQRYGVRVITRNLNEGNRGALIYLCYI